MKSAGYRFLANKGAQRLIEFLYRSQRFAEVRTQLIARVTHGGANRVAGGGIAFGVGECFFCLAVHRFERNVVRGGDSRDRSKDVSLFRATQADSRFHSLTRILIEKTAPANVAGGR